jgi:8-hydroxy-5-deazaflavin:NADPH oxidoreductase
LENHTTLAILGGTGKEGPGLARRWARAGYKVIIGSRSAEKAQATADAINAELGIDTVTGMENADAARAADISVLTVAHEAHQQALEGLKDALRGKILVDATAQVNYRDPRPPSGTPAARMAQDTLGPEVRVVGAFQNVPAAALKDINQEISCHVLVCSDDAEARGEVVKLSEAAGMTAFEAGGLDNALVVEGLTALLISINRRYKSRSGSLQISGVEK